MSMSVVAILILAVLAYAWVIYPLILAAFGGKFKARPVTAREGERGTLPEVIVLFSAHHEERVICQRLENLSLLDYPQDRISVLVGIDGGVDRTASMAQAWAQSHANVRVVVSARNRGKAAMLRRLVAEVSAKGGAGLLVFTDANTLFAPDAMRRLVAPFADASVGGVCGRLVFRAAAGRPGSSTPPPGTGEPVYWDAETRMKAAESAIDSCLGANGAIYAIRAELFPRDFRDNTIVDDFVLGMKVREQGHRFVFEAEAVAYEELPATVQDEWRRRVRIGSGAYQALTRCWRCLLPKYGAFAWMFWSHKVLRWVTPHLGILLLAASGWLLVAAGRKGGAMDTSHRLALNALCAAVCLAGTAGWFLRNSKMRWAGPFRLVGYFLAMQTALFVGFLRFCRGNLSGAWERTERS